MQTCRYPKALVASRAGWVAVTIAVCALTAQAQVPEVEPLSLEAIGARSGHPLSRDEVVQLVSGSRVDWVEPSGGERFWTNRPDGTNSANQIGTGAGFNPHWKTGRGKWVVSDDGTYSVDLDFGHMSVRAYRFQFFAANGQILMHVEPILPGVRVTFQR
jgi:hypothetical protein